MSLLIPAINNYKQYSYLLLVCSVLLDSDIPIHRKIPFARLITWTYLNTERDSLVCCIRLAKCRLGDKEWFCLRIVSCVASEICL